MTATATSNEKRELTLSEKLARRTVILHLCFHCPPLKRQTREQVETDGDQEWFTVSKDLLKSPAHNRMRNLAAACNRYVASVQVPGVKVYARSFHCLSLASLDAVLAQIQEFERQFLQARAEFLAEYEICKQEARKSLKTAYAEADYRDAEKIPAVFWVEQSLLEQDSPGAYKVGEALADVERAKVANRLENGAQSALRALRAEIRDVFGDLAYRLAPGEVNGKKKRLTEAAFDNVAKWLALFKARNVFDDAALEEQLEQISKIAKGQDVQALRSDDAMRAQLAETAATIKGNLDSLVESVPTRKISFDD